MSANAYDAAFSTDTTANEQIITSTAGTPMPSVSRSAGSRRSMRGRMRTPLRLSAGSWMAICTNTPSGLPMAMTYSASSGLLGAISAYPRNVMITMALFATGAMADHK